ncbi:MAG: AAA family ATPase [Clostridiales bacterium]|nr:AAA family ATPase [Clostridiales bacterium]
MGKYDIKWMTEKNNQYVGLIRKAERVRRERNDSPSKEECLLYLEAARVCEEIRDKNLSQRAVYTRWEQRRMECEATAREIANSIAPPPGPKPPKVPTAAVPAAPGQPVQTASGFVTKNAVRMVPAETIEEWYRPMPNYGFDDLVGMAELKERLVQDVDAIGWFNANEAFRSFSFRSYLFYGPPGTGKTFLIEVFARKLMEEHGFKFISLYGGDIRASLVGVAEKMIDIAAQEAIDNAPCILFIDEFEEVCKSRRRATETYQKRLTVAFLEAYSKLKNSNKQVVFVAATNRPGRVDEALVDKIQSVIRVPLPQEEDRKAFFAKKFAGLLLEDGFTFADMAEATDNYCFWELNALRDEVATRMKQQAIETAVVYADDGSVDPEKTDITASEALRNGDIRVTRAMFTEAQQECPPCDRTQEREELEAFERSRNCW